MPVLSTLPLLIETARLTLTPTELDDVAAMYEHARDPEVARSTTWEAHRDVAATAAVVAGMRRGLEAGTDVVWVIRRSGTLVGCIGLHGIQFQLRALRVDRAELGYWVGRAHWGTGIATEAALAVTGWAFATLGLHKLAVGCLADNVRSRRVVEKVGFRFLCQEEQHLWRDDRWHAHLRFELLASEWQDQASTLRFTKPT